MNERIPDPTAKHELPPGGGVLDRPREGTSIPVIAVILAVLIVGGGLLLYNRNHSTSTAQLAPPAPHSTPSTAPQTQQPIGSNPAGTTR